MIITRTINDQTVEIELTPTEMFKVFKETQGIFDMLDLEQVLDEECIYLSENEKKKAVNRYRNAVILLWHETMLSTVNSVIAERDPAEEAYEQALIAQSDITEPENNPAECRHIK